MTPDPGRAASPTEQPGRSWFTRNLAVLSGVSLAQDAASELIYPLLPVLLTSVLGAPAAVLGLIEGVAEGVAALVKYIAGRMSDRTGRKPLVAAGYGLAALGKVIVAAAAIWPVVLVGRVVDRIGKGVRGAPRDALLAEGVAPGSMGKVFGFHRATDTLGAVIGPGIALILLGVFDDSVRTLLWVAVIPAVISVALVAFTRERRDHCAARDQPGSAASVPTGPVVKQATAEAPRGTRPRSPLPSRVRLLAVLLAVFALVNFPDVLVLLRVQQLGFTTGGVVGAYLLFNITYAAMSFPAGMLADRWTRSRVYALGLVCFAIGYVGLGLSSGGWAVVALLLVYGGFSALTDGVGKAWISAITPPAARGHAQGLLQGLNGGAILLAGLWAGLAWNAGAGSGTVPLIAAGLTAGVAAGGLWAFGRRLE